MHTLMRLLAVLGFMLTCASPRLALSRPGPQGRQTLSFKVCNGFTNQRLAIFYGAVLAKESGRSLVLPDLQRHGMPTDWSKTDHHYTTGFVPFSTFYSKRSFSDGLASVGVQVTERSFVEGGGDEGGGDDSNAIELRDDEVPNLLSTNATVEAARHVSVGCPFLLLNRTTVAKHRALAKGVFKSLVPAKDYSDLIVDAIKRLGTYNMLHLRIENDWIMHCSTWEDRYNNCFASNVLRKIGQHIADKGISNEEPLYIATDWPEVHAPLLASVRRSLKKMGYDIRSKLEPAFEILEDREIRALKDYYLALGSQKFIGNSVSTFSALVLLERQFAGKWSSYYNMGNIPLESFLPFYEFPWVFTYSGRPGESRIVKKAINAAAEHGGLLPFCEFKGKSTDKLYNWLINRGIFVLNGATWEDGIGSRRNRLTTIPGRARKESGVLHIPFARDLEQYNYALYTGTAVIFQSQIEVSLFPAPFPEILFMTRKDDIRQPCAADLVLMNLPSMRRMYQTLTSAAFDSLIDSRYKKEEQTATMHESLALSWILKRQGATNVCSISNAIFKKSEEVLITESVQR